MGSHRRHQAVRPAPLTVVPGPDQDASDGSNAEDAEEVEDQEMYGLRVNWQSEAVRIEAAEFLVATRVQHDARIRAAHDLEVLRRSDPE